MWYAMIWYDTWYDMIWYAVIWYDLIWYVTKCYDIVWYSLHFIIFYKTYPFSIIFILFFLAILTETASDAGGVCAVASIAAMVMPASWETKQK